MNDRLEYSTPTVNPESGMTAFVRRAEATAIAYVVNEAFINVEENAVAYFQDIDEITPVLHTRIGLDAGKEHVSRILPNLATGIVNPVRAVTMEGDVIASYFTLTVIVEASHPRLG